MGKLKNIQIELEDGREEDGQCEESRLNVLHKKSPRSSHVVNLKKNPHATLFRNWLEFSEKIGLQYFKK